MSVFLSRFPLYRMTQRHFSSCRCPEDSNICSTTFKVNAYTTLMVFSYGGAFSRMALEAYRYLESDIKELKNEIKTLQYNTRTK